VVEVAEEEEVLVVLVVVFLVVVVYFHFRYFVDYFVDPCLFIVYLLFLYSI
jgi:hypothetical protein